jgi:Ca2+-binding EF-hand superfamily protein
MKRFLIGAGLTALIAIPALAMADQEHHGMRGPMTRADVEQKVKARFAEIDANKDGVITREEADAFRDSKQKEMRQKMFDRLDANKDGQISREEFDSFHRGGAMAGGNDMHQGMGGEMDHGRMEHGMGHGGMMMMHGDTFAKADANGDGKVTLSEATSKALEMFDRADANHDGTVTPEERRAAFKARMEQRRTRTRAN